MRAPGIETQQLNINIFGTDKQYSVFFDDVEMPEDALLGEEGQGGKYMFAGLNAERLLFSQPAMLDQALQALEEASISTQAATVVNGTAAAAMITITSGDDFANPSNARNPNSKGNVMA